MTCFERVSLHNYVCLCIIDLFCTPLQDASLSRKAETPPPPPHCAELSPVFFETCVESPCSPFFLSQPFHSFSSSTFIALLTPIIYKLPFNNLLLSFLFVPFFMGCLLFSFSSPFICMSFPGFFGCPPSSVLFTASYKCKIRQNHMTHRKGLNSPLVGYSITVLCTELNTNVGNTKH